MKNFGYACINMGFSTRPKSKRITTNRSMIKRTFLEKGIGYASELALQNVKDLHTILEWNLRMIFTLSPLIRHHPVASEYDLTELPDYEEITGM